MIAVIMMVLVSCTEKAGSVIYIDGLKATYDVVLEEREGRFYKVNSEEPFSGIQSAYYEDGSKVSEAEIIDGFSRFGTIYNADGSVNLKTERIYQEDTLIRWLTYYPDGTLKSSYDWTEDPVTGFKAHKQWYPNGQLKFEAPLKGSSYHGLLKYYDESGTLLSETIYEDGVPVES